MTQLAIHITSNQYTYHHTCPLLLPVSNVSKRKSHHHKALLCAYWRRSRAWPSQMNYTVSPCQWSRMYACVCAFTRERLLMIPCAWPSWVRPHVCVRMAGVRAFIALRYRMRGRLACTFSRVCVRRACVCTMLHTWLSCMCTHVCA